MKKAAGYLTIMVLFAAAIPESVRAHCQVPCGIYDDQMRIHLMEEHVATIEKSMNEITAKPEMNQAVRWVMNKDKHADELSEIVTYYFMAQRIKPPTDLTDEAATKDYVNKLTLLHAIQIHAMKAKQSTDLAEIATLRDLVSQFRKAYFGEEAKHTH